jgi:Ni/Co efflux regulator RcnB
MRLLVLSAAIAATVLGVLPASAQIVIQERGDRAVVREHMDRDGDHDRDWRRHHADCREVRVRTRLDNGRVIFKTRRTC